MGITSEEQILKDVKRIFEESYQKFEEKFRVAFRLGQVGQYTLGYWLSDLEKNLEKVLTKEERREHYLKLKQEFEEG